MILKEFSLLYLHMRFSLSFVTTTTTTTKIDWICLEIKKSNLATKFQFQLDKLINENEYKVQYVLDINIGFKYSCEFFSSSSFYSLISNRIFRNTSLLLSDM